MLLLLAVVQSEDARGLSDLLLEQGLRLTQINSTGGLFGFGNVLLLLGVEEDQYPSVMSAIQATCRTRMRYVGITAPLEPLFFLTEPMEVEVGGAVVFGVPVERFVRLPGGGQAPLVDKRYDVSQSGESNLDSQHASGHADTNAPDTNAPDTNANERERNAMKLIVAIVHADEANAVIQALLEAEHRLTRINTTGGFLRRGNATLLIGVKPEQVDEVIHLIQTSSGKRKEPAPLEQGIPEYAATVFVLDATHFARL
jgi:uncharacterized protein YaaQ